MARKNKNARPIIRRRLKSRTNVRVIYPADDGISPGRLVAAAEYTPIKKIG